MQPSLSLAILFFGLYLALVLLLLRLLRTPSPALLVCGSAVCVYFFGLIYIGAQDWRILFFAFSSLYWFLTMSLIMVFGAVYKSISLRMMLHLLSQPGKTDSYEAILESYIKNQSYLQRIEILVEKKWLEKSEKSVFRLTKKGCRFAERLWLIQRIFSIQESG